MVSLGIDLGGTAIKSVAVGPDGDVLWRHVVPTGADEGREVVLARLVEMVDEARLALAPDPLEAVGFAIPGVLNFETETVERLTNFAGDWAGFPLGAALRGAIAVPVSLINDVRAATFAEQRFGAGRPYRHFVCLAVGTGIGGGLVLDGRLYLGGRGAAGEIGHQTVLTNGPRCNCGNHGCVEALASGYAIARDARQAIAAGDRALLMDAGGPAPTPREVARAAEAGNETARRIYTEAGTWIGLALANVVCVLNPDAIVVGGGVAAARDLLFTPLRAELARRTVVFTPERGGAPVLPSPLGGDAGALGAAAWAVEHGAPAHVAS